MQRSLDVARGFTVLILFILINLTVFHNMETVIGYKSESDQYLPTINIEL